MAFSHYRGRQTVAATNSLHMPEGVAGSANLSWALEFVKKCMPWNKLSDADCT